MTLGIIAAVIILFIIYVLWDNQKLDTTHYSIKIPYISESLKGIKLLQISDPHIRNNRADFQKLIEEAKEAKPDLIVLTGDLVQAGLEDFPAEAVTKLAESLTAIAPTYAVTGNHDFSYTGNQRWQLALLNGGAQLLLDKAEWIPVKDSGLVLMGLAEKGDMKQTSRPLLQHIELPPALEKFPKILLAHHPEFFEEYLDDRTKAPDLVLAGHTHGGQVRLPFIGGLFSPGQGLFPKYDYGYFYRDSEPARRLIINRGIGNSTFPFRVFNRPEIVVITLQ
ncbi:metallophosphoesterase [Atopococcus tabaci]|uniref:metallophosphoesterase n=1 Tax=Atopococcus tabaci TaxID=269774 RepID=UPI0003FFB1A8|nr:metallophosphoesterase [Atopococcus tabaci]